MTKPNFEDLFPVAVFIMLCLIEKDEVEWYDYFVEKSIFSFNGLLLRDF